MIHVIPCLYLLQPFSYKFIPRFMNIHIRIFGCCLKLGHPEPLLLHRYPFQTWPVWIMSSSKKSLETVGWTRCSTTDGSKSNYVQPMEPEILRSHIYIHLHTSHISKSQAPASSSADPLERPARHQQLPAAGVGWSRPRDLPRLGSQWAQEQVSKAGVDYPSLSWLVVGPPLWKILVNWNHYSQYMGK